MRVISALSHRLSHRVNQSSLPHLISPLPPSLCCSSLFFTSNPPVSVSVPVARRWLLPSFVSLCHTLAAPAASLPLLLSPSISSLLYLSFSLPCSLCLSFPRFLVFHSIADLGEIIVGDKFLCLPLTQRKGLLVDLLAPGLFCIQASVISLPSSTALNRYFFFMLSTSSPFKVCYVCLAESVVDAVYIG